MYEPIKATQTNSDPDYLLDRFRNSRLWLILQSKWTIKIKNLLKAVLFGMKICFSILMTLALRNLRISMKSISCMENRLGILKDINMDLKSNQTNN